MRASLAVFSAFLFMIAGWLLLALLLMGMGYLAARARPGLEGLHLANIFLMWLLGPMFGGFVALFAASRLFKSVDPGTIATGFYSVIVTLGLVFGLVKWNLIVTGKKETWDLVLFATQICAILGGAKIAQRIETWWAHPR